MTSSIVNWEPIFREKAPVNIILDAFSFLQDNREITIYAYVVMRDHIHFIASGEELTEKVRLFKSYTARKIIDDLKGRNKCEFLKKFEINFRDNQNQSGFQLWQKGFHPKQIVGDKMMLQKIDYTHNNPVKAGYVNEIQEWEHSSIHNYLGQEAPIEITCYRR